MNRSTVCAGALLSLWACACAASPEQPHGEESQDVGPKADTVVGDDTDDRYLDIHTHVACFGTYEPGSRCYVGDRMRHSVKYRGYPLIFGLSWSDYRWRHDYSGYEMTDELGDLYIFEHLARLLARPNGFSASVVLAMDEVYDQTGTARPDLTEFHVSNEFVLDGIELFPDRFLLGASVHPFRPDAVERVRELSRRGAVLVKLIAATHRFPPDGEGLDESLRESLRDYYLALADENLPLLIHVDDEGSFATDEHAQETRGYVGVHRIRWALDLGVTVIVAHAASSGSTTVPAGFCGAGEPTVMSNYEQLRCLVPDYPNLYADISVLPHAPVPSLCRSPRKDALANLLLDDVWVDREDRLLWGSDYPLNHWTMNSYHCFGGYHDLFRDNGVTLRVIQRSEKYWERTAHLARGFGLPERVFGNSRAFLERLGRLPPRLR